MCCLKAAHPKGRRQSRFPSGTNIEFHDPFCYNHFLNAPNSAESADLPKGASRVELDTKKSLRAATGVHARRCSRAASAQESARETPGLEAPKRRASEGAAPRGGAPNAARRKPGSRSFPAAPPARPPPPRRRPSSSASNAPAPAAGLPVLSPRASRIAARRRRAGLRPASRSLLAASSQDRSSEFASK